MVDHSDERTRAGRPGDADPHPVGPRPLGGLADLAELLGGESPRSRKFLGGLVIGGLVGAVVAGGSLLRRRSRNKAG
jgi:hypothetical protein